MNQKPPAGRPLRERVLAGERLLGVLVRAPAEELVEMAAVAGFDLIVLDCEHGPADTMAIRQHIAAAAMYGVDVLVRVGYRDDAVALRALDAGACGVIGPHVDDADDARALVASAHYPPTGTRGFATYGRAGRFGTVSPAEHLRNQSDQTLVVAMVESPRGVDNAEQTLAVPGIDAVLVGAADLTASSGPKDPPVARSRDRVRAAAHATGTARVELVAGAPAALAAFDDGAQIVVYNLTHVLMACFAGLAAVRRGPTG